MIVLSRGARIGKDTMSRLVFLLLPFKFVNKVVSRRPAFRRVVRLNERNRLRDFLLINDVIIHFKRSLLASGTNMASIHLPT